MLSILFLSMFLGQIHNAPSSRLAVIRQAPEFTLVSQDDKSVKLSDLKGKVVLVSFVFTTCNGACPATTHRMAKVRTEVDKNPIIRQSTAFLTITLDPQRDTPEAWRNYMKLFDIQSKDWTFLTGPVETVEKTIAAWGMWVKPAANGQLDHPSRIYLVDQQQRIREIYNVDLLRPAEVLEDIAELLKSSG